MYAMWNKIKDGRFHIRTRSGVGAGRDGHGRQYPPYLQAVRNDEDQERSSDGGESQTSKILFLGIEEIEDPASMRQALTLEEEDERTSSATGERLMTALTPKQIEDSLMNMSRNYAALSNTYGNIEKLLDVTADIASIKAQAAIPLHTVALVLASYAETKAALRPEIVGNYEESIVWTLIMQGIYNEREDKGLPRVQKSLSEALAQVGKSLEEAK